MNRGNTRNSASYRKFLALIIPFLLTTGIQSSAIGEESEVELSNFEISLKASKEISRASGKISTTAVVGEEGRFCTYIYVLDISTAELGKLKVNPLENFEYLVGSGTEFKNVAVRGFSSIKSLCDGQKKSLTFSNKNAIPKEMGWKRAIKSGTYVYVAVLGFSNDPNLSKFAIPSRIVAVSDFIKVKVRV